ncbi:hypothetical protein RchiOBHm_Chr5g0048281 [Rosa chinensis]|uniref:Uncharacterized protein n=1 Tax=Rosa chinensis TaxID=74649 RepID=A0A2P6QEK7_ROSCH|nr:hypothetical protein RchiOBHm_Chr5g0048281 [Rosa chinensis]
MGLCQKSSVQPRRGDAPISFNFSPHRGSTFSLGLLGEEEVSKLERFWYSGDDWLYMR